MTIGDTLEYNYITWELWLIETIDEIEFYHLKEVGNPDNGICIDSRYIN